jgi:hypothetical protein
MTKREKLNAASLRWYHRNKEIRRESWATRAKKYRELPGVIEKRQEACTRSRLKKKYGLTAVSVTVMLEAQNHACAICLCGIDHNTRVVDHNHDTNKVRQLLCKPCNTMLGMAHENTATLFRAIGYLQRHSEGDNAD